MDGCPGNTTYNGDERSEEQEPNEVLAAASANLEIRRTTATPFARRFSFESLVLTPF